MSRKRYLVIVAFCVLMITQYFWLPLIRETRFAASYEKPNENEVVHIYDVTVESISHHLFGVGYCHKYKQYETLKTYVLNGNVTGAWITTWINETQNWIWTNQTYP